MVAGDDVLTDAASQLGNSTTTAAPPPPTSLVEAVLIATLVSLLIVGIVVGNAFVVASVAAFREMRTLTNWMIVSLASADLLVAVAVLPLSAYKVSAFYLFHETARDHRRRKCRKNKNTCDDA